MSERRPPGMGDIDYNYTPSSMKHQQPTTSQAPPPAKPSTSHAPAPNKPWADKIKFNFECPVCHAIQKEPIALCKNGHLVCADCSKQSGGKCNICNRSYSDEQNEEMVRCKNDIDGCEKIIPRKFLLEHLKICDYRPVPCFTYGCWAYGGTEHVPFATFVTHFQAHKGRVFSSPCGTVANAYTSEVDDWPSCRWVHAGFEYREFVFFLLAQKWNSHLGIWLWVLGNAEDAKRFRSKIVVGSEKSIQYKWEGPVHSIRKPRADIMREGACFLTTWNSIKHILSGKSTDAMREWTVGFYIYDAKQEYTEIFPAKEALVSLFPDKMPEIKASTVVMKSIPCPPLILLNTPTPRKVIRLSPLPIVTLFNGQTLPTGKELDANKLKAKLMGNRLSQSPDQNNNFDEAFLGEPDDSPFEVSFGTSNEKTTAVMYRDQSN